MSFHGLIAQFFFKCWVIFHCCMYHSLFICSPIEGHLGYFQVLEIMSKDAREICVQVFVWTYILSSFGSVIAGLYDKTLFSFVRNHQTVFQSGCTSLHSHQQCMRIPVVLHPYEHLVLSVFWILAILIGMQWSFIVLICISLMTYDVEDLLICLFAICVSSLVRYHNKYFLVKLINFWFSKSSILKLGQE